MFTNVLYLTQLLRCGRPPAEGRCPFNYRFEFSGVQGGYFFAFFRLKITHYAKDTKQNVLYNSGYRIKRFRLQNVCFVSFAAPFANDTRTVLLYHTARVSF